MKAKKSVREIRNTMSPQRRKAFDAISALSRHVRELIDELAKEIWPVFSDDEKEKEKMRMLRKKRKTLESVFAGLSKRYRALLK